MWGTQTNRPKDEEIDGYVLGLTLKKYLAQSVGVVECTDSPNMCPGHDTKSDGEVPVMLELWGMQSTPLLPLLPGPFWPGMLALDRALSMGLIELNCIHMLN